MKKLLLFITILAIGLYYINEKTRWITNRVYEIKWGGDWYADKLKIEYEPLSNITNGSLSLEYAFDGI